MSPQASLVSSPNVGASPSGASGYEMGQSPSNPQGFFGAVPVVQPSNPSGNIHTVVAGAGAAVKVDSSFDGSLGSSAYTIGDLVIALKNLGLIAM